MGRLPAVKPKQAIKALQKAGFFIDHQRGSHVFLKHPERHGLVVVPYHSKDMRRGTLSTIIDQAGLTVDEFINLL